MYVANETGKSRGWPGGYTFHWHINRLEIAIALSFARSLSPTLSVSFCVSVGAAFAASKTAGTTTLEIVSATLAFPREEGTTERL